MQANDDYILLLSKQFSGDISPEETSALRKWLAQSPENELLAAELRQVWEKSDGYGKVFSPDLDAAYRQIQAKIKTGTRHPMKAVPLARHLMRIAAALALVLAAVWAYREFSAPVSTSVFFARADKQLISLPDGSQVWLRKNGTIEYPTRFSGDERHVKLKGEAYFEVVPDPAHPFFVDISNGDVVKVLGTEFGVRMSSSELQTDVFVRSGKVFFSPKMQPGGVVLTARQKASYDRASTRLLVDKKATLNELAWQTGGLEFESTPMEKVIADLETHYKVKILLRNAAMRSCPHTALHTTQPIEKVLESLALTHQFRVTNPAPGQFELAGGTCQ